MEPELPYFKDGAWVIAIDLQGGKPGWMWGTDGGVDKFIMYDPQTREIYQENCAGVYSCYWEKWHGLTQEMKSMIESINGRK